MSTIFALTKHSDPLPGATRIHPLFSAMRFRFAWRSYQARVLERLDREKDRLRRLHVVAPPGAGKTVLGLEIVRRLARPTLILAPTLTIRNQWVARLREDFITGEVMDGWISTDLRRPGKITVSTYQALHAFSKTEPNWLASLYWLQLLVTDECHHLRREWWRVLERLQQRYRPFLLALTATPPFDVSGLEWRRYHQFCGPIDEEISVPELVAAGDLCYHQDFVWVELPTPTEQPALATFRRERDAWLDQLRHHQRLRLALLEHPYLTDPEEHQEAIFDRPAYFTSLLVVLKLMGSEPPAPVLGFLHDEFTDPPAPSWSWLEEFCRGAFFDDPYFQTITGQELLQPLQRELRRLGALEKGRVRLSEPAELEKSVRTSLSKLEGVARIVETEYANLGDDLRLVILTDYIRPELLPTTAYDQPALDRLGAVPIFELLRRRPTTSPAPALLTGSTIILPATALDPLLALAYAELPATALLQGEPLAGDPAYRRIASGQVAARQMVRWVTQLFEEGHLQLIIGTKSLLGEGWDAPSINTLILANTVGSYVLSNQMRGRAIRTHAQRPEKTANIWHLVTLNPTLESGGADLDLLRRRFRAFAGPTVVGPSEIRNGLERFPQDFSTLSPEEVPALQRNMQLYARARPGLRLRWTEAIAHGDHLVEAIQPPTLYRERRDSLSRFYYRQTGLHLPALHRRFQRAMLGNSLLALPLAVLLTSWWWWSWVLALALFAVTLKPLRRLWTTYPALSGQFRGREAMPTPGWRPWLVPTLSTVGLGLWQPWLIPIYWLHWSWLMGLQPWTREGNALATWAQYQTLGDTSHLLQIMGEALLTALIESEQLSQTSRLRVCVESADNSSPACYLAHANHHDAQLFTTALAELLSPIDNPRYLLALRTAADQQAAHYLAVPTTLARRKADAEALCRALQIFWPHLQLVYTRHPAGRQTLLRARALYVQAGEDARAVQERRWR